MNSLAGANTKPPVMEIEPYKLSEIFKIVTKFDGDQIFLQTLLDTCDYESNMATNNRKLQLVIHMKK